ncbi:HAD family hydrolase [Shewanella litorisediminis]|uniref:HAD family hydrolase n=1 Tax=Shewanella litorisediminis TaxID=1173586 RepID=A0ABX7G4P9_9GAMM|nr:HAD family hydrolase [Shewanella litorisediminis]MCL2917858.1 HAD family hydrolase [Shewanella litorisediminis]QRH02295.1 HAD family hydrolase [Shewanella litorisediminis]
MSRQAQQPVWLTDIRAVAFDLDGTLAHSNPDFPAIREALGLTAGQDILAHIAGLPAAEQADAMATVHHYEMAASRQAQWVRGAAELLEFVQQKPLPTAILTRNMRQAAELTLSRLGLSVELLLTREDAPAKPDPAGLIHIMESWQLEPAQVLYVGDYLFDLQTARSAGCRSALYCPEGTPDYGDMADLLVPCYFEFIALWRGAE